MKNPFSRRRLTARFRPSLESLETRLTPTTFTVSTLADSGDGSLRAAITSANADTAADEIDFSVAGVIQLTSGALPAITNSVKIDGTTAPNFAGVPLVEIDNNGFAGLVVSGSDSTLASLSIVHANGPGVTLSGSFGSGFGGGVFGQDISVIGNYIGLALDGSIAANTGYGVQINESDSTIGGTTAADRNVISGNGAGGIQIDDDSSGVHSSHPNGALVEGNFIGTDLTGQSAAPNQGNGITVVNAGSTIGGTDPGDGNIIAFNTQAGVAIESTCAILSNSIFNNGGVGINFQNGGVGNFPAPQLSYAMESPGSTSDSVQVQVGGVLNVSSAFFAENQRITSTIQVFATLNGVPAGQGQLFLGSTQVTSNANGFAKFTMSVSVPAGSGTTFTATATLSSSTSTFSSPNAMGGNPNNLFVASVYGLLLNRNPDSGASFWVNLMNNGASAAGVVQSIEGSPEYLNDQVDALYSRYLRRSADPTGAQAFTNFLLAGGTLEQVAALLTGSQEYYVVQGGTNQGFIGGLDNTGQSGGLYLQVLSRFATAGEVAGWEAALDSGVPRLTVALAFLTSQEYRTNLVQSDYLTFLQRPADSGGITAWVGALNAGATDQQVLAQIFGSAEGYQLWS